MDIEAFLSRLNEDGMSLATQHKHLRTLKILLKKAVEWGYLAKGPAETPGLLRYVTISPVLAE